MNTFKPTIKKPAVLIMPRSEKPSPMKRSYGAGLADGEGCIQIVKQKVPGRRNPTYRLRFEMMQNDFRTLEHFVHCVGIEAKIRLVNRDREGKQNRQVWRLAYEGPQAYAVIRCLQRYLVADCLPAGSRLVAPAPDLFDMLPCLALVGRISMPCTYACSSPARPHSRLSA